MSKAIPSNRKAAATPKTEAVPKTSPAESLLEETTTSEELKLSEDVASPDEPAESESPAAEETETETETETDAETTPEEDAEANDDAGDDEEADDEEESPEAEEAPETEEATDAEETADDDEEEATASEEPGKMENQTPLEEMSPAPEPAPAPPVEVSLVDESQSDIPAPSSIVPDYSQEVMRKTYRDIVRYEQEIGDLCAKLSKKDSEVLRLQQEVESTRSQMGAQLTQANFQATKQLIGVVLQNISMTNIRFQHLTDLMLTLALKDNQGDITPEALKAAIQDTRTYSEVITGLITGAKKESIIPVDVMFDAEMPPTIFGMSVQFGVHETAESRQCLVTANETAENCLHGLKFALPEVLAQEFRAVSFAVKPAKTQFLRVRIRFCDAPETRADITVNLANGVYAGYFNSNPLALHSVSVQRLKDGWVQISFRTSLVGEAVPIELYVLGVPSIDAKVNRYDGDVARGFALRGLKLQKFNGYLDEAVEEAEEPTKVEETLPQKLTVELKMPGQELKRADLRRAYLNSGEYGRLAGLRGIHAGRRAFILGNGPSVKNQDLTLLKNEITFATNWFVNHPQMTEIDPKYYCVSSHEMFGGWGNPEPAVNKDWYKRMALEGRRTTKFFSHRFSEYINKSAIFDRESVYYLLFDRPKYQIDQKGDLNLDLSQPMDDGYTGIITFCLPLAHFMGIREIYLLGCDCDYGITTPDSPKQYFYDFKMHTTATTSYEGLQRAWADDGPVFKTYEAVRRRFALDQVSIINCTDGGRLEVFPRERYEDVISRPQK